MAPRKSSVSVPTEAGPPFNKATADVILRSSDQIDFRVHKSILIIVSPVFETLFSLPQVESNSARYRGSSADFKDDLPIVRVAQDGATLEDLLRFYYPSPPEITTIEKATNLLHAARYYQIDDIMSHLRGLMSTYFLEKDPMRVYAIAWRRGWKDIVERAALKMLARELIFSELLVPDCHEMGELSATALLHLFTYHQDCGKAARSAVDGSIVMWSPDTWRWRDESGINSRESTCGCAEDHSQIYENGGGLYSVKKWWCDYLEQVRDQLRRKPCTDSILSRTYPSIVQAEKCQTCSDYIRTGVYYNGLVEAVEEAVRKVPLEFGMTG